MKNRLVTVFVVLAIAWLVVGCGSTEYVEVPVEVKVPVPVPCSPEIPEPIVYATRELSPAASDGEILRAMLIEIEERGAVESTLRALLVGCGG